MSDDHDPGGREDEQGDRAQRRAHTVGEVGVGGQDRAGDRDAEGAPSSRAEVPRPEPSPVWCGGSEVTTPTVSAGMAPSTPTSPNWA
ncbi:hypothetical protein ACGFY9_31055 [Streptomyces sp. NPDC048504]|uniref:hypothetical protein n=1 Tax=Streptomyces sp. NPDC048504 TaxID=3365559 RepID=UPI003712F3C4